MADKYALVVDDTPANRDFLERFLTMAGFGVRSALTGTEALAAFAPNDDVLLAVVDMELPDMNGLQLTTILRQRYPKVYLVVATMHDERSLIDSVWSRGGNAFLVKPHGFMELFKRLTTMDLAALRDGEFTVFDQYGPRGYTVAAK